MTASGAIAMRSHVYGSTPRGFATLFADNSFERDLLGELERRCSYSLPASLARQEHTSAPMKYLYGVCGSSAFVGRARYLGVDLTGRLGNYVCHTLVFDLEEAASLFESPLGVLVRCDVQGHFLDTTPCAGTTLPPLVLELTEAYRTRPPYLSGSLLVELVSAALQGPGASPPILMRGAESSVLDALEDIFSCLPSTMRWRCTFDTYGLGGFPKGVVFSALPSESAYSPVPPHSALVDLDKQTINWTRPTSRHPHAEMICRMANDPEQQAVLLSAIDLAEATRWSELADTLAIASTDVLATVYAMYRPTLLERIGASGDRALALILDGVVRPEDLTVMDPRARAELVRTAGPRTRSDLVRWVVDPSADVGVVSLAFSDDRFLASCLEAARATRHIVALLVTLLRTLPQADAPNAEELLLWALLEAGDYYPVPAESKAALLQALKTLPEPAPTLAAQRWLAEYRLGDTSALLRCVTAARGQPGYWETHLDLLRSIAGNVDKVPLEIAAQIISELLAQNAEASRGRAALDRTLASVLERPGGLGSNARTTKKLTKTLRKQGAPLEDLPFTTRALALGAPAAPRKPDNGRGGYRR